MERLHRAADTQLKRNPFKDLCPTPPLAEPQKSAPAGQSQRGREQALGMR